MLSFEDKELCYENKQDLEIPQIFRQPKTDIRSRVNRNLAFSAYNQTRVPNKLPLRGHSTLQSAVHRPKIIDQSLHNYFDVSQLKNYPNSNSGYQPYNFDFKHARKTNLERSV